MPAPSCPVVTGSAYLTLHYRLAFTDGENIVSTFGNAPATLQLGQGQLAPFLEACLMGLPEGAHETFELAPEQGFGPRNPELMQWVSKAVLARHAPPDEEYKIGDLLKFAGPNSEGMAAVVREVREASILFDFNHPLAGRPVKFEVKIIGIL